MKLRSKFIVKGSSFMFYLGLVDIGIIVFIIVLQIIANQEQSNVVMYACLAPFMIPGIILILMAKMFKVTVNGHNVSVRTWIGYKYHFDVSEVENVVWKKALSGYIYTEQIKIKTRSGKKVRIENLMDGFEYMSDFISVNVDASKIHSYYTIYKPPADGPYAEKSKPVDLESGQDEDKDEQKVNREDNLLF